MMGALEMRQLAGQEARALLMPTGDYLFALRRIDDAGTLIHVPSLARLDRHDCHVATIEPTTARGQARLRWDHEISTWVIHAQLAEGWWMCPALGLPKGWVEWDAWLRLCRAYAWPEGRGCAAWSWGLAAVYEGDQELPDRFGYYAPEYDPMKAFES